MSKAAWYWHRLRAMTPSELAAHGRRKIHQLSDRVVAGRRFAGQRELPDGAVFPELPPVREAPDDFKAALRRDAADILRGRWIAFGHLALQVENPPRWHKDYLAGVDMATNRPALKLHHRLEGKADIKLIWEPNRWFSLVRLAQAACILGDIAAAKQCLSWLDDWVQKNPPYFGWNWTSGLESGLRLIQFVWIDALLSAALSDGDQARSNGRSSADDPRHDSRAVLARIRAGVLPPHLWFTWRDRSFGSSANNHLLGELAGLILALVRWPGLTRWAAPLDIVQRAWETQVLTQFAPDGGNQEQALNYHLFGFEFCWQARLALRAAGRSISTPVEDRLRAAAAFFSTVQTREDRWDYGDSDSAYVTPFFTDWSNATTEWHDWLTRPDSSPAIRYWIGEPPKPATPTSVRQSPGHWRFYTDTGLGVWCSGDWFLRWDLSPLGYLATAGHGHCDALHLSIWYQGRAVCIDPGTGVYHVNRPLRDYLASWDAHNGPHPVPAPFPERKGAFLWSARHEKPRWQTRSDDGVAGELKLPDCVVRRSIGRMEQVDGWQIDDAMEFTAGGPARPMEVLWQLAPGVGLNRLSASAFLLKVGAASLHLEFSDGWQSVECWSPNNPRPGGEHPLRGSCAPAFRDVREAPFIRLRGEPSPGAVLRTTLKRA